MSFTKLLRYLPQIGFIITTLSVEYDIVRTNKDPLTSISLVMATTSLAALSARVSLHWEWGPVLVAIGSFGGSVIGGGVIEKIMD